MNRAIILPEEKKDGKIERETDRTRWTSRRVLRGTVSRGRAEEFLIGTVVVKGTISKTSESSGEPNLITVFIVFFA